MRDLLLLIFVLGCLGVSLRYPFVGLLTWAWFTIMTPHQMAFGTFGIPLNLLIAAITIFSVIYSREASKFRFDSITLLLFLTLVWQTIAQQMSLAPEYSGEFYSRFSKTLIFVLLCAQMASSKLKFHALLWILVGGIGLYAAKGALFTILTFGQYRVHGLENTILEDNNHFGIAAATVIPLMIYLRGELANPLLRKAMVGLIIMTLFACIGTHSRGALVSVLVFAGFFWLRSSHKIQLAISGMIMVIPALYFMPKKWIERMNTITEAGADASFQGRLAAWEINFRLALDNPITGVGLRNSYLEEVAIRAVPEALASQAKAAHSIYFEILGGSGFVGLGLLLTLIAVSFLKTRKIEKSSAANIPNWSRKFATYAQISLLSFCIGGASVSMEMWDGYLVLIALIGALSRLNYENFAKNNLNEQGYAYLRNSTFSLKPKLQKLTNSVYGERFNNNNKNQSLKTQDNYRYRTSLHDNNISNANNSYDEDDLPLTAKAESEGKRYRYKKRARFNSKLAHKAK